MKDEAKEWLEQAKKDLETADYLLLGNKQNETAFFAQQAAEKTLKAVQIEKLGKFDHTHDLVLLATSLHAPKKIIDACKTINPSYFSTRYPDTKKFNSNDTRQILKLSKEVNEWSKQQMN
ncbi:HEPN domain-containing protein [Candidatus Woesearchaeota archaeon]|nr:HEPN domain-containing protein [Candidatus Woesearchaeota archaeon]